MSLEYSNNRDDNLAKESNPPSIYDDATSMISVASSVYIFATLRETVRDDRSSLSLVDFEPPMTTREIILAIKANKEALKDSMCPKKYNKLELMSQSLAQRYGKINGGMMDAALEKSEESQLVEFVDTESNTQLVHAIAINRSQKRVTVAFRGSANKNNFITNSKIVQTKVENPVYILDEKLPEKISLHSGFHKYLFKRNKETGNPRIEEILASVKNLLCQNPGYQLYCTGHSLGGALSSLFAFYAAADEEIIQLTIGPVRVVSVASPYVGNARFLLAFQALERRKRLQHLRIANKEDIVTLMPRVAPNILNGAVNRYEHCGIKLHLKSPTEENSESLYELSYLQDRAPDEKLKKILKKIAFDKNTEDVKYYHR